MINNKKSAFWTIGIYASIIIVIFVMILTFQPKKAVSDFTHDELTTKLRTDSSEFKSLTITPRQTKIVMTGVYVDPKLKTSSTFRVEALYSESEINELNQILDSTTIPYKIVDIFERNIWVDILISIAPIAIIFVVGYFMVSKLATNVSGSNSKAIDFGKSRANKSRNNSIKFTDVAGCEEEKTELTELVEYLKFPDRYKKMGSRFPKGILLIGPPGTGKTLLAKAVAGEANVPFFYISGSDFVEMFVGVGASRVRDMFKTAKSQRPCIVFIDEIDAVGRQRGAGMGGGNDEREQTLNQLLVELDGFEENAGVLVIAATNRADVLDPALQRPGRFDRTVFVSLPDKKARAAILKVHSRNKKINDDVIFDNIAQRTQGFSGAQLENVINEASILAVRRGLESIGNPEIEESIDRVIGGPARKSRTFTEHEKQLVAYHEAGHAVLGLKLELSDIVQKVTIIPRGNAGGYVMTTPKEDRFLMTKSELLSRITGFLGGRVSEELFFNEMTTGAQNDIQQATRLARAMVTELGMSSLGLVQYESDAEEVFLGRDYTSTNKHFSAQVAYEIDKEVRSIIENCHETAKSTLQTFKDLVEKIAKALLQQETLTAEEISALAA